METGPITILSLDVVRKLLTKTGTSQDGTVDLSPPKFSLKAHFQDDARMSALSGLRHVSGCSNEKEYFTKKVRRVILSGNDLAQRGDVGGNLMELRVFRQSVECILAENCHLTSLGWHPDKKFANLVELDLSRNFIQEIPDLSSCPKLHVLNLANNEITKMSRLGTNLALMNVDLSGNKIDYDSVQEMKEDMQQGLGALTSLLNLKLEKNPMTFRIEYKDRYRDVVMFSIAKCRLTFLDGPVNEEIIQRAKKVEARVEDPISTSVAATSVKTVLKPKKQQQQQQDLTFPCTLSDLDAMIDDCLSTSSEASALLDKLQVEASRIVAAGGGGLFLQEERANASMITQEFLQKTIALSERRPELRKNILTVLATLCRVEEEQEFGTACFRQLRVFMGANEETKEQVISVINEVIPLHTITDIRLVEEMTEMAEKTGCPELLSRGSALPFVVAQLRSPMLHTPNKSRERETCFHFLAVTSRDESSRVRFGQESVGELLAPEFDKPNSPVRLWVLETVKNLSASGVRNGRKSTNLLFADYVVTPPLRLHTKLLRELDAQRDTDSAMALEIDVLCVLLERSKLAFTDLCASGTNALYEVLSRFFLPKETKHLLTEAATYRLVGSLLTTATHSWCPLVTQTSTRTRKDILDEVQRFMFNGKDLCALLDFFKQDSLQYSECWSAAKQDEETPAPLFKDLNEPKIHHLVVSIIDLIRAFNTAAQSGLVMAKGVNDRMNARGRENRLFACLEIPSDSVRLAAVRCLDTVKLSQFDSNEIQFLLKLLKEVRDVSFGKTEEVLSVSLGILTKLSKQGGLEFERKFGKTSVEVCLKLLEMNVNRDTRGMERESEEKRSLTAACIKLLLQALAKPNVTTQQHMLSDAVAAKVNRILVVEDGLFDRKAPASAHDPVLVELTSFSVANLTSVFVGVNPNGPVAARVLRRIANLLTYNRDTLVMDVEQSVERTPQAVQWVALDAQRERDMDSESWSMLAHAMRPTTHEEDTVRIKHHEQFMRSSCLNQILQKLAKTIGKQQLLASGAAGLIPPFSPINPRLGHPNASLQQLLERHLMCERERSNNLDTGGDLRSLTVNLSTEQLTEAQRDLSREHELENLDFYETLASSVRVLFASVKFGSPETIHVAQQTLRDPQNFLLLINLYFGSKENPQFARYQLGAKLFFLLDAVLDLPPMRRQEHNGKQMKEFDAIVFACADVAMGFLRKRLQSQSRLAPGDEFLIKACMSVCTTVAHQLEYLDVDNTPEEMFRQLVPSSLLSSALQLLLFDMSPKKSLPMAFGGKPVRRDAFGESVEDGAREKTIAFLSYCLRHSPPHRYSILEFLIRSNITDPFPVRRILIQELMKRTHKIGSTQRVALEYLLSDCEQDAVEEDIIPAAAKQEVAIASTPAEQPQPLAWFAWCTGAARKPDSNEPTKSAFEQPTIKTLNVVEQLWDKFSVPTPSPANNGAGWIADRLGPRARVVAHSFVMYCDEDNAHEDKTKTWFYESCLVLTSEHYYLFRVNKHDFDFPKRWTLLWKRPYRALTRIALGSARIHLAHRANDAAAESQVVTMFTPSRVSAKEIATSFYQLSIAWHALLRLDANPPPPVAYIENGHSERFRVANSMSNTLQQQQQQQAVTVSNGMIFCDLVRFCIGEKDENWRLGLALIQHETLLFVNKQEWVFEDGVAPSQVLAAYEMAPKTQILKPLLRVVDFSLNSEPPSPALVLEFGTSSEKKSVAIVFLDDLTRTVWRKYLVERFFKTVG